MPQHARDIAWRRSLIVARAVGSLLLGGVAVLGAVFVFRQGLLPVVDAAWRPGPEWLSAFRRTGILLAAMGGYWAYVHWHEKRKAVELRLQPIRLLAGGASGALLVALPMAALFAVGAYKLVHVRDLSPTLLGVAALILIAATLEELIYRCLLFRVLEGALGTWVALAVQAVLFALAHVENLDHGGAGEVITMLVSVSLLGLLWGALFAWTRNLWVAVANHAAWNFTILLSGVPLSGNEDWRALAPLNSCYAGPDWLTGGRFGPENSLLVMVSALLSVVLLLRALRRQGAALKPPI